MKRGKIILIIVFNILFFNKNWSTTYTWSPTSGNSANNAANWTSSSGPGLPATSDDVVFDATSVSNCTWDISSIRSFSVLNGYTGDINMGTTTRIILGNLVVNSGSVLATSGDIDITVSANSIFEVGGTGIFNNNGGNINLSVLSGQVFSFIGNIVLNQLFIDGSSNASREINFGSNLTVTNLSMVGATKVHSFQGTVHVKNTLDISSISYSTVPSNNTANFIFDGTSASLIGVLNFSRCPLPNIEISTTGAYSITDHLNIRGNWTGTQGTLTAGSSTVNMYGSSAAVSGTAVAFDNLNIQSGAVVSMPANAEVKLSGSLTGTGTINFQPTTVLGLNGTGLLQTISGSTFTLKGIKSYSTASGRFVSALTPISILDFLEVGNNVTFNSTGNITLKSSSALTARVAELGSGASVSGNVIVETLIPGGTTGWANLGVRGVSSQTLGTWDNGFIGTSGFPMTCAFCFYDPFASSLPTGTFVSVQGWNESTGAYSNLQHGTSLTPGIGIWAYVGDGFATTNNLTCINTGPLVQGNVPISLTAAGSGPNLGSNLVANPYASPVKWSSVLAASAPNINNAIYVYKAELGQTSYVSGVTSHSNSGITNIIPAGQGFYVVATANTNLIFTEATKVDSNTSLHPLLRPGSSSDNYGKIIRLGLNGIYDSDQTVFRIHSEATGNFDGNWDAYKYFQSPGYVGYPGPYEKYTTISSKDASNTDYSINSLPPLTNSLSVPLLVRVSATGSYTINAFGYEDFAMCVNLYDKLTNTYHDLRLSPYVFTISDTTSAPRFELILCKDESLNAVGITEKKAESNSIFINQDAQGAYVKTAFEKNTKACISVYNVIGQKLMKDISVEGTVTNTPLPIDLHNQVVLIKVTTDKESVTKKVVLH